MQMPTRPSTTRPQVANLPHIRKEVDSGESATSDERLRSAAGSANPAVATEREQEPALHLLEAGAIGATGSAGLSRVAHEVVELLVKNIAERGGLNVIGTADAVDGPRGGGLVSGLGR
jgi:hypothetical protein